MLSVKKTSLVKNLIAGITVAIVALPLAIGFGITSGMTAAAGIATAIIGGFLAAVFGGSKFQVSGPTGAMTVVLIPVIQEFGVGAIPTLGFMAGIFVLLMAAFRLGRLINSISWAVVEGFTVGIAVVIALQQIPFALEIPKGEGDRTLDVALNTVTNAMHAGINWKSVGIVVLTLLIKFNIARIASFLKIGFYVPASFMALSIVSSLVILLDIDVARIGEIPRSVFSWNSPFIPIAELSVLIVPAILIALLVAIESLLSARVADSLASVTENEKFQANRELAGQGLATSIASIFGGMPATGAIARTNVNVRSRADSRLAAASHSVFLFIIVFALSPIFNLIPTAAIAGVLIGTSFRILNPKTLREMLQTAWNEKVAFFVTALLTISVDLIWGIAAGIALYKILNLKNK